MHINHTLKGKLSLQKAWENLASITKGRVKDNEFNPEEYPLEVRKAQLVSIKALVSLIDEYHKER